MLIDIFLISFKNDNMKVAITLFVLFIIINITAESQYNRLHNQSMELKVGLTNTIYPQLGIGMNRGVLNLGAGYAGYIDNDHLLKGNIGFNFRKLPWRSFLPGQYTNWREITLYGLGGVQFEDGTNPLYGGGVNVRFNNRFKAYLEAAMVHENDFHVGAGLKIDVFRDYRHTLADVLKFSQQTNFVPAYQTKVTELNEGKETYLEEYFKSDRRKRYDYFWRRQEVDIYRP